MNSESDPQLAPPGAGLPAHELVIGRVLFAFRRLTGNRDTFNHRFQRERVAIRELLKGVDAENGARRVLIPRLRGMEDSSRNWSVWMTLDHLRIVHGSLIRVIGALTKGIVPGGVASTATVKPSTGVAAGVVEAYERSCDELLATASAAGNLKTRARYRHPWFGPLDAAGWHALASGHLGIHRAQIASICDGLRAGR